MTTNPWSIKTGAPAPPTSAPTSAQTPMQTITDAVTGKQTQAQTAANATPGAQPLLTTSGWGNNPYNDDQMGMQAGQATSAINQNVADQTAKMNAYQNSGYPAMANAYGLGTQPTQGSQSGPNYLASPISVGEPDASSRGFNPWSLQGEALSRG